MTVTITALSFAGALTLQAQAPQSPSAPATPPQASQPDTQRPMTDSATKAADATITVTGCVKSEADVPGLTPNVAASVTDNFILTNVKMSPASKVSGIGLASMYEIKELAGADVKKHVNHEVELTGRVSDKMDTNDKAPDFHATGIKMLAATCAAQ
jgi:hypothetical protein